MVTESHSPFSAHIALTGWFSHIILSCLNSSAHAHHSDEHVCTDSYAYTCTCTGKVCTVHVHTVTIHRRALILLYLPKFKAELTLCQYTKCKNEIRILIGYLIGRETARCDGTCVYMHCVLDQTGSKLARVCDWLSFKRNKDQGCCLSLNTWGRNTQPYPWFSYWFRCTVFMCGPYTGMAHLVCWPSLARNWYVMEVPW